MKNVTPINTKLNKHILFNKEIKVENVAESAKIVALNINEHSTDEGHSPETSGHLLRFSHFQQNSQLLFPYCSNKCHAAFEVFNYILFKVS